MFVIFTLGGVRGFIFDCEKLGSFSLEEKTTLFIGGSESKIAFFIISNGVRVS
jgi:hypothetical protein